MSWFRLLRPFATCLLVAFIAGLLLAATSPEALPPHAEILKAFLAQDQSGNRAVGLVEWSEVSDAQFNRRDVNRDDVLSRDEIGSDVLLLDTSSREEAANRALSRVEFRRVRTEIFQAADIDRNSYLTFPEYELLVLLRHTGWKDTSGYGRILPGALSIVLEKAFRMLDRDGNGLLAGDELAFFDPAHVRAMDPRQSGQVVLEQVYRGYRYLVGFDTDNQNQQP
jgi:hypothetical protein